MEPAYAVIDADTRRIKMRPDTEALAIFESFEAAKEAANPLSNVEVAPVAIVKYVSGAD